MFANNKQTMAYNNNNTQCIIINQQQQQQQNVVYISEQFACKQSVCSAGARSVRRVTRRIRNLAQPLAGSGGV